MADENNETKQENAEANTTEKTEGKFKGFFKKVGQKLDDATYAARMQSNFDKNHKKYTIYEGTSILSATPEIAVEEHLEEGYLVTVDDDEQIKVGNLIEDSESKLVRHISAVEDTTLTIEFEGKSNIKPAKKITLGDPATKVDVIKVGDSYYLK